MDDGYKFGDYIIIPENGMSFSSSAANLMMPGNQLEQTVFCVASGAEVPQGSTVVDTEQEHSIMDFAPTICSWLGVAAPEQAEGSAWEFSTDAASAPVIALDQPDSHYQLTYESLLRLQGSVSQGTETLTVNGETVELNDSAFEHSISLQEGINIIDLAAANVAGKQTHKYLTVDYRPLPEKEALNRVVYINFDGFADYYFDEAEKQGLVPVLSKIKNEDGIYFDNAYTNIPSITNPMQNAIIAGAPPIITDNYRKYFNKEQNVVLTQEDGTRAENLAEAAVRQGLSVISINQFITEERGTAANEPYSAYVTSSYGASGYSDGAARFDELIKLVEEGKAGKLTFEELPQFIMLYADDLDGLGHNHNAHTYGTPRVYTEEERMDLVLRRLQKLDEKIGEMIEAFENAGLMETTTFILTTDHGMTQYGGMETAEEETAYSQLEDLRASISALGEGFNCEVLTYHETPAEDTDIVLVTYGGLTANLSYVNEYDRDVINEKNQKIIEMVQQKPYFGAVMEPEEMQERGTKMGFADLIISPKTPYHFSEDTNAIRAQGNHDSILESSQKIASFMWGGNVEKGVTYTDRIYNYEFTAQMAALMGINAPLDSIGTVRNDILSGIRVEESSAGSLEAETAVLSGSASEENGLVVLENDGTTAAEAEWTDLPESSRIIFRYPADTTGTLALYHNGEFVRNIFFPSYSGVEMSEKIVNLSLEEGDSIKLTCERSKGNTPVSLDSMYFTLNETVEEEPEVPTDPDTPTTPENPGHSRQPRYSVEPGLC